MPIAPDVRLGKNVKIFQPELVNLYGCSIGEETKIGAFVEIQKNAFVGARCKISSHSFVCEGVTIEDEVFDAFERESSDHLLEVECAETAGRVRVRAVDHEEVREARQHGAEIGPSAILFPQLLE